jgi:tight adherence protein B
MSTPQAIALLGGAGVFFALQALFWATRSLRQRRDHRIQNRLRLAGAHPQPPQRPLGGHSWLGSTRLGAQLSANLAAAGLGLTAEQLLVVAALALAGLCLVVAVTPVSAATGAVLALLAAGGAWLYVRARRAARTRRLSQQLPAALDMMRSALGAGRPLEQALQLAGQELADPLGPELARCHERFEKGRPLSESLQELAQRNRECSSIQALVQALLVLRRAGGNLLPLLGNMIETLRVQAAYEARYRALTTEGRVSGTLLGALPLAVAAAVLLLQPDYLAPLVSDRRGRPLLAAGVCLWCIGALWLRRLAQPGRD